MLALMGGAFLAGLVGSPHCVGMCGGFAAAVSVDPWDTVAWHGGRMTTYAALGAVAGFGGAGVPGPPWVTSVVATALLVWFAARLGGWVPEVHWRPPGVVAGAARLFGRPGVVSRYGFGIMTGLLPCGLVYAALGIAVAAAKPGLGALAMLAFGAGTLPILAVFATGIRAAIVRRPWFRQVLAASVLAAGLTSVALRSSSSDGEGPACHEPSSQDVR